MHRTSLERIERCHHREAYKTLQPAFELDEGFTAEATKNWWCEPVKARIDSFCVTKGCFHNLDLPLCVRSFGLGLDDYASTSPVLAGPKMANSPTRVGVGLYGIPGSSLHKAVAIPGPARTGTSTSLDSGLKETLWNWFDAGFY